MMKTTHHILRGVKWAEADGGLMDLANFEGTLVSVNGEFALPGGPHAIGIRWTLNATEAARVPAETLEYLGLKP